MQNNQQVEEAEFSHRYFLTAGETDAQGLMPMRLIIERAIEVATEHANKLGIGYAALIEHGIGWVLARISIEMVRFPRINEEYVLTTWVESFNRLYSDRCFVMTDTEGNTLAHIRSMWIAIDMTKRTAADLSIFQSMNIPMGSRVCPITKPRKLPPLTDAAATCYTFKYSDIDFNRHVNTVQYVRILLNHWSLDFFDRYQIEHFDIAFHQECYYGETVSVRVDESQEGQAMCELVKPEGIRAAAALLRFVPRQK